MSGVAVDADDHVWVLQRPGSLSDDEKGATFKPPLSKCCAPAPPVLEFDASGKLLRSWGGPGPGYDWPGNEHGIHVDAAGYVWITGNGEQDGQILKFTRDGKFVMQIGKPGPQTGNADTTRLGQAGGRSRSIPSPTSSSSPTATSTSASSCSTPNTGAYKRHWGAYGEAARRREAEPRAAPSRPPRRSSSSFGNPVHCARRLEATASCTCATA